MQFIRHIQAVMRYMGLPAAQRRLTFYCEGINYWPHLEGLLKQILATSDIPVCYITSDAKDPGLSYQHKNLQTFKINEGFIRNYLFENLQTEVMVMTMPDLHQYQVKRSKHPVHYVYVQHSLVSLHMIYRKGAFDHFDSICCAGEHHKKEIRAMEKTYALPKKNLIEHGYARLDSIIKNAQGKQKQANKPRHILIAPTWGENCTIESGIGEKIIDQLIDAHYKVTLRPHPQTIKFANDKIRSILSKHQNNDLFHYEGNVAGQESLHASDVMICDWSGAALEYAFGLKKPVLFIDVPRKVNNKDYQEIGIEPFEVSIRDKIGCVLAADGDVVTAIENLKPIEANTSYYYKNANVNGAKAILNLLTKTS